MSDPVHNERHPNAVANVRPSASFIKRLEKLLAAATMKSAKACDARAALPPGSSRARVTTANARWRRCVEDRDRLAAMLARARDGAA